MNTDHLPVRRQVDSVAALHCPRCGLRRYLNQHQHTALRRFRRCRDLTSLSLLPICCNILMDVLPFGTLPPPFTVADLVAVRLFGDSEVSALTATDREFETWAWSQLDIGDPPQAWSWQDRTDFCDVLLQLGLLRLPELAEKAR